MSFVQDFRFHDDPARILKQMKSQTPLMTSYLEHEQRIICADREVSETLFADSELIIYNQDGTDPDF